MKFFGLKKKTKSAPHLFKGSAGFTLIEMLVAVFVIGMLSSIMIINLRKNEKRYELQIGAQKVVQGIRKAQEMALSGTRSSVSDEIYNYGIYFYTGDRNFYTIFADPWNFYLRVGSNDIETTLIGTNTEIDSLYTTSIFGLRPRSRLHINFSLPDGFTTIRDDWLIIDCSQAIIRIRKKSGTCPADCKDIVVEKTGRIRIQ